MNISGKENVIPIYEDRDSTVILSFTLGEVFPYSTLGRWPRDGVWKYFTSGEGKYNCTVPLFIYRYVTNSIPRPKEYGVWVLNLILHTPCLVEYGVWVLNLILHTLRDRKYMNTSLL